MTAMIAPNRGPTGNFGSRTPKGYEEARVQNFTPKQLQLFQQMFSQVSPDSYTSRLARGDQDLFAEMEAPARRDFAGQQGNIASRFSGIGLGGRKSSGFQNTMNQASSDFAQNLQSRRQDLMRQAIQDLMGMSTDLLSQRPYSTGLVEKQPEKLSFFEQLLGGALPAAGAAAGGYFGGPMGAQLGGQMGNTARRMLLR